MEAAIPTPAWVPGGIRTDNGGQTYYVVYGTFDANNPNPISARANSKRRFELGYGISAGVYQELGATAPAVPTFALGACQLTGTCTIPTGDKYGFDLTKNPDDPTPIYKRNREGDVIVPSPRTVGQLLAAWDWGNPAYCRSQLLALGFTTADLTP